MSHNGFYVVSTAVAVGCSIFESFFVAKLGLFYYYAQYHSKDEEYVETYSALLEEYGAGAVNRFTPIVMNIRVALAIPLLVIMSAQPVVQAAGFGLLNLLVFAWVIVLKPGNGMLKRIFLCIREALILGINGVYMYMAIKNDDLDLNASIVVILMIAVYVFEMLSGLIDTVIMIIGHVRGFFCEKKESELSSAPSIKVHPAEAGTDRESELQSDRPSLISVRTAESRKISPENSCAAAPQRSHSGEEGSPPTHLCYRSTFASTSEQPERMGLEREAADCESSSRVVIIRDPMDRDSSEDFHPKSRNKSEHI